MTTTLATRTSSSTPSPNPTAHRLTLGNVVGSEWIKATSLRSIRWSILVSVALGIGMSLILGFAMRALDGGVSGAQFITTVTGFPGMFLSLVFAVLGVFVFSSEYASGMILSTLAAAPRRGAVVAAKALVLTAIAAVVATLIVSVSAVIAVLLVPEAGSALGTKEVISSLIGTVFFLVAVALLAFGVAGIVRSTAGAVTIVVGIVFVGPMIFQVLSQLTDWTWVQWANEYLPSALGSTLGYGIGSEIPSMSAETSGVHVPDYWEAMLALGVWVLIPMAAAVRLFFARDAK